MVEKIKGFTGRLAAAVKAHKVKVSVYAAILLVAIISNRLILKSVYEYTVDQYERYGSNAQVCEDGIATFRRMKYDKQAKHYIRQMTISGVEDYCEQGQFTEAENFLNENYDEALEYLYTRISSAKTVYEEEQRKLEEERQEAERRARYNSAEGRTERVKKMYSTMGLGGITEGNLVIDKLVAGIELYSLDSIGYLLPVWNRNQEYFDMLMYWFRHCYDWVNGNSIFNMSVQYTEPSTMTKPTKQTVINHFRNTYNLNIDIQDFAVYKAMIWQSEGVNAGHGQEFEVFVFKTEDRWFFGGFFYMTYDDKLESVVPGNKFYTGVIADDE
jgi:hypothetical protein